VFYGCHFFVRNSSIYYLMTTSLGLGSRSYLVQDDETGSLFKVARRGVTGMGGTLGGMRCYYWMACTYTRSMIQKSRNFHASLALESWCFGNMGTHRPVTRLSDVCYD
jgi:hypothetical protein